MKVSQAIELLKKCDPDSMLEDNEGVELDAIYYHAGMKRIEFCTEDEKAEVDNLAPGWIELS